MCVLPVVKQKNTKKNLMMRKDCRVPFCLWCYCAFHEVKHVEKLREHVKGVMDKNGHCAGSISTQLKFKICSYIPF